MSFSSYPRTANLIERFQENSPVQAANGVWNGQTIDTGQDLSTSQGAGSGFSKFRVMVYSDVAGTVNIQQSRDGATWRTTNSQAVAAGVASIVESLITRQFVRVNYVNGAGAQATFEVDDCLVAI